LAFTVAYAIGLYVNGWLGDRINLKKLLMIGTLTVVLGLSLFGTLEGFIGIEKIGFDMIVFGFNGLGQSVGYPACISIINNWFGSKKTGLVFGLWGMHINVGNILGQQIGRFVINNNWHWANALIMTCVAASFCLTMMLLYVKVHPKELNSNNADLNISSSHENSAVQMQGISFMKAWKIQYVPQYALAYLCINGVIYAILLWLPTYLVDNLRIEGDISSLLAAMELGQLVGSVTLGLISDKIKSRPIAITFGFFFSVVFLAITSITPPHVNKHVFLVFFFLTGFGLGGPGSLISGAVASDLGKALMETQNINAISTITGIMKGCGAAGAAATQLLIANFTSITFPFFAGLCGIGGLLIAPMALEDFRKRQAALAPPPIQVLSKLEKLEKIENVENNIDNNIENPAESNAENKAENNNNEEEEFAQKE